MSTVFDGFGRASRRMADLILDTAFFIDLRREDPGAVGLWTTILNARVVAAFATITAFELWQGSQFGSDDEAFYQGLLGRLEAVPLSAAAAALAGEWLRPYPRQARERLSRDALIAASAFQRLEAVSTRNVRDFSRFPVEVRPY